MTTATIALSESENLAIQNLSRCQGKTEGEILHEAVEQFLIQHRLENRLAALRQARGIWHERDDLPNLAELRNEWNRS